MKIAAQHSGLWQNGEGRNTAGNIAIHEAWAKMMFGKGFFGQVGRQELSYDDERLLGTHDWAATGRAHDALRLGWENDWHSIHAIASFKQTAQTADNVLYKNMQVLWYHYGTSFSPFQISFRTATISSPSHSPFSAKPKAWYRALAFSFSGS